MFFGYYLDLVSLETKITKEIVEHGTHKVTCQLSIPNALLQKYAIRVPSVKAIGESRSTNMYLCLIFKYGVFNECHYFLTNPTGVHNNLAKASTFAETKVYYVSSIISTLFSYLFNIINQGLSVLSVQLF